MASPLGVITLPLLLVLLTASTCAGREAHHYTVVSGPYGLTVPEEPRDHFEINDTLLFRYDKHMDAMLAVNQSHYETCNTTEPLLRIDFLEIGVKLDTSGYLYFISADAMRYQAGERLSVFVNPDHDNTPRSMAPPPKPASSSSPPPPPPPPEPVSRTLSSSAVDLRAGVLACLLVIGASAAIL